MEDRRIKPLDEVCAAIADCRGAMNDLRQEEADLERRALGLLHKHDKQTWRAAGVELALVPGEEKLRIRTSKAAATAEVAPAASTGGGVEAEQPFGAPLE
jgi:hypothetical protein